MIPPGEEKKSDPARQRELASAVMVHAAGARSNARHPVRVGHAVACGKALLELKELLGYGKWSRWVEEHCGINRMTANRYMRLSSKADRLTPYMTIRAAYIAAGVIVPRPKERPP
ncbi:MAG: DUF3102 domain-containing protein [Verrucomicrobiia bacterium]